MKRRPFPYIVRGSNGWRSLFLCWGAFLAVGYSESRDGLGRRCAWTVSARFGRLLVKAEFALRPWR